MRNNNVNAGLNNPAAGEISDLQRQMQEGNARVNAIYNAIGEKYYNANKGSVPSEYEAEFAEISQINESNHNRLLRIKFLNGVVVCTKCQADNSVESTFCSVCGEKLPHVRELDGVNRCSRCGKPLSPGQLFCGVCGCPTANKPGQAAEEEAPAETATPAETAASVAESTPAASKCPHCGAVLDASDAVFCPECGERI